MEKLTKTNYVDNAEKVIKSLQTKDRKGNIVINITTSKLRNMLAMTNNLYNELLGKREEQLDEDTLSSIQYLKMKLAYEAGREPRTVGDFVKKAGLMQYIDGIGNSREAALLFCRYMESLVAYHKYYGGRDK